MALSVWQRTITDTAGNVLAGASVTVRDATSGELVTVYKDRAGTDPWGGTATTDSAGFVQLYAEGGRYNITATSGQHSITWEDVLLGTAAGYDVGTDPGQIPTNADLPEGGTPSVTDYTELRAYAGESQTLIVQGRTSAGDGGGGMFVWQSGDQSANVSADPGAYEWAAPDSNPTGHLGAWQRVSYPPLTTDRMINIPTDYATLQDAFDAQSKWPAAAGVTITLNIVSGHAPASGLTVSNGDYAHFVITADDAEVMVDPAWTGRFLDGDNARMPILDCLINMNSLGTEGVRAENGSVCTVTSGNGVKNSGNRGIEVVNSVLDGTGSVWDGATERGIRIGNASVARIRSCSAQNCGLDGLAVGGASLVTAQDSNFSGNSNNNVIVDYGSQASLESVTATGAGASGLVVSNNSRVNCTDADFSGAVQNGISALLGAAVAGNNVTTVGAGQNGVHAANGASVSVPNSQISTAASPVGNHAVFAENGARVNAQGSTATNAGARGCFAYKGGHINFQGGDASSAVGEDIRVSNGSIINAQAATGAIFPAGVSNAVDTDGIVFN